MTLVIRDATEADAEAATEVMRRSITELCAADHRNDPKLLANWLANKTPEIFRTWLKNANQSYLVATEAGRIVCVGAISDTGHTTLNYVLPAVRFQGISRAMVAALEQRARARSSGACTLESTAALLPLVRLRRERSRGTTFGTESGFPMRKALV